MLKQIEIKTMLNKVEIILEEQDLFYRINWDSIGANKEKLKEIRSQILKGLKEIREFKNRLKKEKINY